MAVPAWRRNRSKLDAEYEAVKFRVIVTQMIMRNFGLKVDKNKYKPLVSQRLRQQYPDLKKFFDKVEKYQDNAEASMELKEDDQRCS